MAKLQKRSKKGAVPSMDEASSILTTPTIVQEVPTPTPVTVSAQIPERNNEPVDLKPMNFKVPPSFKKEYKQFALDNDLKLVEVLKESFKKFKEMHK